MRVLLATLVFFPQSSRGTEVITLELARGLRERGHEVTVLAGAWDEDRDARSAPNLTLETFDGFPLYRLRYGKQNPGNVVAMHADAPDRVNLVLEVVRATRPDVVHFTHTVGLSAEAIRATRALGVPVVFTPTDFWTVCPLCTLYREKDEKICAGPGDGLECIRCYRPMSRASARVVQAAAATPLRWLAPRLAAAHGMGTRAAEMTARVNAADRILPATRVLARTLIAHGIDAARVRVVPYGVDLGPVPEARALPDSFDAARRLRVGFIGAAIPSKGLHVLVEALARLDPTTPVEAVIYGDVAPTDAYRTGVRETAGRARVPIEFAGTFAPIEMGRVLRSLDALVVPSVWMECAPLVLCGAASAGTLALVSRVDGLLEPVVEGLNASAFTAGDSGDLAALLVEIAKDPARVARARDLSPVAPRRTADYTRDIETVYHELLSRPLAPEAGAAG